MFARQSFGQNPAPSAPSADRAASPRPIWLWSEGDAVRLWTPDSTAVFPAVALDQTPEDLRRLTRDAGAQLRLERVIRPPDLAHHLAELLATATGLVTLHLADRSDAPGDGAGELDWPLQSIPFEWLRYADAPPLIRLCVCRHVPLSAEPAVPAAPGPVWIADLWPRQPPAPRPLAGLPAAHPALAERLRLLPGTAATATCLAHTDPTQAAALVVFAHGLEDDRHPAPLQDPQGRPWAIPTAHGLSPLVLLLACGTDRGNLVIYGRDLLAQGARTVIAPFGRLEPGRARGFLDTFLPRWLAGERADLALLAAQDADPDGWGARRLTLIGQPGLRCTPALPLAEQGTLALAAHCRAGGDQAPQAAALLANRLTLQCFQRGWSLGRAAEDLHRLLIGDRPDGASQRDLFQLMESAVATGLPGRLTQVWLYPRQAQGAEQHAHDRLAHYESQRAPLMAVADLAPALAYHDWNRLDYRHGRYAQALEDVIRGLRALPASGFWPDAAPLARSLANLLIEFDVPAAAVAVAQRLDERLGALPHDPMIDLERHKWADTLARARLRVGGDGWRAARGLLTGKRHAAERRYREPGHRELAWLLYATSWGAPQSAARGFADEVRTLLADVPASRTALAEELGNSDRQYLLRAFAVWVWRSGSVRDAALLEPYRPLLEDDLHRLTDPGPLGLTVGFLNLHASTPAGRRDDPPCWPGARERLRGARSYLEAAAIDALLGHRDEAARSLELFHSQCAGFPATLERLAAGSAGLGALGIGPEALTDWAAEATARQQRRWSLLAGEGTPGPADLVTSGLLPL
jgi:hypothetical protein